MKASKLTPEARLYDLFDDIWHDIGADLIASDVMGELCDAYVAESLYDASRPEMKLEEYERQSGTPDLMLRDELARFQKLDGKEKIRRIIENVGPFV